MKLLALLLLLPIAALAADVPQVGSPAPDFTLNSQEGKPITLKKLEGNWVVLYFYPKDFTKGCTIEAHNFQEDLSQYKKKKVTILGVSVQTPDSHKSFCEKEHLNFKLLADVDHAVSTEYGSTMEHKGEILSARNTFIIGPDGLIKREFVKVNPAGHSKEVLAALTELQKK
ncbi:MAG TPA: peroxiredoxin [Elusimicrobiota bacterium]|nr:peroxiredoxin [Elusimicrobiota bacterium]